MAKPKNVARTAKPTPVAKRNVTLVRSAYQPSKAEMEKVIDVRKADGSMPTPEKLAQAALRPVNIKWKDRP